MHFITLDSETDFEGWRKAVRALALNDVGPSGFMWAALLRRHLHPARLKVKAMQTEMPKK